MFLKFLVWSIYLRIWDRSVACAYSISTLISIKCIDNTTFCSHCSSQLKQFLKRTSSSTSSQKQTQTHKPIDQYDCMEKLSFSSNSSENVWFLNIDMNISKCNYLHKTKTPFKQTENNRPIKKCCHCFLAFFLYKFQFWVFLFIFFSK